MGKYDEFDLDIKQDKNLDIVNPRYITEDILGCVKASLDYCPKISKALDCLSENSDCSDTRTACTPCGSGYRGIARC